MGIRSASVWLCSGLLLAGGVLFAGALAGGPARSAETTYAVARCSSGLVALTFDDGPSPSLTPDFIDLLHARRVPATFFVIGGRVRANPAPVRRASRLGFTIGNQTFGHKNLPYYSDATIARTLRRTQRAIRQAGAVPSNLMRPPFGSIDDRVRAVVAEVGLVPVLWTADPRDWDGRSARSIAAGVLAQLDPHRPNVVLLHDGVGNSVQTLRALPRIIEETRARGYCLADLDRRGRPAPPVPGARVSDASVKEAAGGTSLAFTLRLDRPTSRPTSVRVRTEAAGAEAGVDYVEVDERVTVPRGSTRLVVGVRVRNDRRDERRERLVLRLADGRGMRIVDGRGVGTIVDDDDPPRVILEGAEVAEPTKGTVEVPVVVRLARASERWARVTMTAEPGTAGQQDFEPRTLHLVFTPGEVTKRFVVTVLADTVEEVAETFEVRVVEGTNVLTPLPSGVVTILPPVS